jgi:hypothetical protein
MSVSSRNINDVKIKLKNINDYFSDTVLKTLRNSLESVNKMTGPVSEYAYESMFTSFERYERETSNVKLSLDEVNNLVKDTYSIINEIESLISELKTATNKNKLKYGLQGQMKQMIRKNNPEITTDEREFVNEPFVETPYNRGGKKTKRRVRKNKSRRNKK